MPGRLTEKHGDEDEEALLQDSDPTKKPQPKPNHLQAFYRTLFIFVLPWVLNALCVIWILLHTGKHVSDPSLAIYSPANSVVEYKKVVMYNNIDEISPYQGYPDDTKDALWISLYENSGMTLVKSKEAAQLPSKTVEIPGRPGQYVVQLEVFHQLHCLNVLRRGLYPERFPEYAAFFANGSRNADMTQHHDHCIDRLRQGVQCASNLGTLVWNWREDRGKWMMNMTTTHTCRNYEKIHDWAESRVSDEWDLTFKGDIDF